MTTPSTAPVRRWIVRITIGSFSVAALMGIAALLGGGDFGETEGQVLMTTLLVGVVSIAVLCYLATAGRGSQPVGIAGGVTVLVPLVTGLVLIWGNVDSGGDETVLRTFGVGAIVAATLAQASLLLTLGDKAKLRARRLLLGTIVLAGLLAVMTSVLVLGYNPSGDGYYRALGVIAILDVLGTVVGAALMKFGSGASGERVGDSAGVVLPPDLAEALSEHAARTGRSRDELAVAALREYLDQAGRPASSRQF